MQSKSPQSQGYFRNDLFLQEDICQQSSGYLLTLVAET